MRQIKNKHEYTWLTKGFKSRKLNHSKDQNSANCIPHIGWRVSWEKTASFFKLYLWFSPTVRLPPTLLLSWAQLYSFPQKPSWDCSTGFSLWQAHCQPSSRAQRSTRKKGKVSLKLCHHSTRLIPEMSFAHNSHQKPSLFQGPASLAQGAISARNVLPKKKKYLWDNVLLIHVWSIYSRIGK